jgi:hypothetical protein
MGPHVGAWFASQTVLTSGINVTIQAKVWDSLDASATALFSNITVTRPGLAYAAAALNSIMGRNETTLSIETFINYFLVPTELSAVPRLNVSMRQDILNAAGSFLHTQSALYVGSAEAAATLVHVVTSGLLVQLPAALVDQAMRVLWEAASKSPEGRQLLGDATMNALSNLAKGGAFVSGTKNDDPDPCSLSL